MYFVSRSCQNQKLEKLFSSYLMLTETVMCYLFSRFKEIFKGNFCLSLFNFQGPKPPYYAVLKCCAHRSARYILSSKTKLVNVIFRFSHKYFFGTEWGWATTWEPHRPRPAWGRKNKGCGIPEQIQIRRHSSRETEVLLRLVLECHRAK